MSDETRIKISRKTEARLADKAKRLGISVDALLESLIEERAVPTRPGPRPELPLWNLGACGPLRRHDIYDDVC